jgi:hypothetical protein
MKRSSQVTLTVVAVMGLAGCSRHYDPCEAQYFNALACNDAITGGGYYWHSTWYPMRYRNPYPFYYDAYQHHVATGGKVFGTPPGTYSRPAITSGSSGGSSTPSGSVTRGGFGSTGSGHGAGS